MKYNKLIRDKIPDIIAATGKTPITYFASEVEYRDRLKQKLMEEALEYEQSGNIEELADILEVIHAICECEQIDMQNIEEMRKKKREERGSLEGRIILKEVEED